MKVALCFIISYNHILQKENYWIKWIEKNKDLFNIYFHYKNKRKIQSKWILSHCIPEKYIKNTTYFNVVPAYMSLLTYAYSHDSNNQWFCMLTDSCVPIISPSKFRHLFFNNYNKSIIRCSRANWNIDYHKRANLRMLTEEFHLVNDPWFTMCRYHVHLCSLFMAGKYDIYSKINEGGIANESIFAIILQSFNEFKKNRILNTSGTLSDWFRMSSPTSPHLFTECSINDEKIIIDLLKKNKYALFLRKVSNKFPDEKLDELSMITVGHKYEKNNKWYYMYFFRKYKEYFFYFCAILSLYYFIQMFIRMFMQF
jgi:hypothetical protein